MNTKSISKQAINKLNRADITVKLINGCFNRATVKSGASRSYWEVTVDVTHPLLKWQCGDKNDIRLVFWNGNSGEIHDIPTDLIPLIEKMRVRATMEDDVARKLSIRNHRDFYELISMVL